MALQTYVDAFNVSTAAAGTTIVRTGYGFAPKALLLYWSGRTESVDSAGSLTLKAGLGIATSPVDRRVLPLYALDAADTTSHSGVIRNAWCAHTIDASAAIDGQLDVQSMDSDGVTFIIDDAFATDIRLHVWALGGADLTQATCGTITTPTTPGTQSITVPGSFQPDIVVFLAMGNVATEPRLSMGYARSATQQACVATYAQSGVATSNTHRYGNGTHCLLLMDTAGTGTHLDAALTQMTSTGFDLNWTDTHTVAFSIYYLALKGGLWHGFTDTTRTTTTPWSQTGFGFQPSGLLVASVGTAQQTRPTPTTHSLLSVGAAASATNRGAQGFSDEHNLSISETAAFLEHDAVYVRSDLADGIAGIMDVQSFDADGLTLVMDDPDPDAAFFWGIACGNVVTGPVTRNLTAMLLGATTTPAGPGFASPTHEFTASLSTTTTTPAATAVIPVPLAHDAVSESHTGTTGSTSATSFTWNHTPVGTPKGVLVFTFVNANANDATAVTYDGAALTAVPSGRAVDTAGPEPGDCKAWFLGASVPTTIPAPVIVSRNNTTNVMYAVCITVQAPGDTEVKGTPVLLQEDGTHTEQNVDAGTGVLALRYAGTNSGLAAIIDNPATPGTSLSRGANSTALADIDFSARVIQVVRETTGGTGSRPVGFSATTSDDRAAVHVAIGSVVVGATYSLTAVLGSTTTTPDSAITLTTARNLVAALLSATTTLDSPLTQEHALTATLVSASTTPASAATQAHALTATLVSATTTPPAEGTLATVRPLTAGLLSTTATPDSPVMQARSVTAGLLSATSTPTSPAVQSRSLTAALSPATTTPASAALQARALTGGLLGDSNTPAAAFTLARLIALVAALDTTTSTPAGSATQGRTLTAGLSPATTTPISPVTQSRALTSALLSATTTPASPISITGQIEFLAAVTSTTSTPNSAITQARSLTAGLLSPTTTPTSACTQTRHLTAALAPASTTPGSPSTQGRALTGTVTVATATPPVAIAMGGLLQLQASLLSSTSTPASPATQARTLAATLGAATSTAESPIALATLRQLVAACTTATATPPSPMTLARSLTAQALGSTTTPNATPPTVQRGLTASVSGTTSTPPIPVLVTGQVVLLTHLLGQTSTSAPTLQVGRALTAAFQSATSTPATAPSLRRNLTAQPTATTATPASLPTVSRALLATPANTTSTPTAPRTVQRALLALVPADSLTPPIAVAMAGIRQLSAGLVSVTTTPDGTAAVRRPLTTALLSTTSTPSIVQVQQQALTAVVGASTSTPAALPATTVRALLATLPGVAATPPATARSRRELTATLLHDTVTPDSALGPLVRALTAAPLLSTLTPPVLAVETVRTLMAAVLSPTLSPPAPIIVQGQVLLFAGLVTATTTPDAAVMQVRALVAALDGLSSSLLADLTPGSWGEVLRPLAPPVGGRLTPTLSAPHGTVQVSLRPLSGPAQGTITPILRPPKAA